MRSPWRFLDGISNIHTGRRNEPLPVVQVPRILLSLSQRCPSQRIHTCVRKPRLSEDLTSIGSSARDAQKSPPAALDDVTAQYLALQGIPCRIPRQWMASMLLSRFEGVPCERGYPVPPLHSHQDAPAEPFSVCIRKPAKGSPARCRFLSRAGRSGISAWNE